MKFTFGIVTITGNESNLQTVLDSISSQYGYEDHDDLYEVIVVGGNQAYKEDNYTVIPFDETKKKRWITRKKNIITENARFSNIVYMHDYVALGKDWFRNFEEIHRGVAPIMMTPIINADGTRYRDWTLWPHDLDDIWGKDTRECLLPYDVDNLTQYMYISGAYWIAWKSVMEKFPLNEELGWGESEDVEWSKRVRQKYKFTMNKHSPVHLLKQKDRVFGEITPEKLNLVQHQLWTPTF